MSPIFRLAALIGSLFLVTSVACTSSDDTVCRGGSQCVCNENCSKSCDEAKGGCEFVCNSGTCNFDCAGGNCQVSCTGSASCNVDCPKGGCRVSGGTAKTDVKCGGLGTCTVACPLGAASCLVDGQSATPSTSADTSGAPATDGSTAVPGLPAGSLGD